MLISSFFASRPRDATRRMRMSATELLTSAQLRRSGDSVASVTVTSKRFDVAHSHSHGSLLLRRLVCTRQACCLFVHVALMLLPLSLFLGVRAPSLSLGGFRF